MSLHLHSSNRLEVLADAFNSLVSTEPLPPLLPEVVVLQSGGMARWLSMQIAGKSGICANLDCPFPNQFVDQVFKIVLAGEDFSKIFDRNILQWQLMKVLPAILSEPGFALLAGYLVRASELKMFRLAGRLADLFDQYTIFRPEMVLAWESGADTSWQAKLWRHLRGRADCQQAVIHRAALHGQCLAAIAAGKAGTVLEQGRFSVFGLSSIPPYHLEIFTALAEHLDVHFFFMNPCREYWDDIVSGKRIDKLAADHHKEPGELYLAEGNPLLAVNGRQGRELISIIHARGEWEEHDLFQDPLADHGRVTVLKAVQSDILNLRSGRSAGQTCPAADRSIMFHSCHSPVRELEVLYDQLLKMFVADPALEPRDILVMVPDIESYSPLIQAVFSDHQEEMAIPFSIADRRLRNEGVLVRAFQDILDLRGSRFEVSRILGILEHGSVRRKFGFTPEDFERIEKWLVEVNVRWAVDPESKMAMGLPGTADNTWRQGLDRLLLGYAMAGNGSTVFAGILPADNIEGNETEVLGRFIEFTETLFAFTRETGGKKDLAAWADLLAGMLHDLLEPDGDQQLEFSLLGQFVASLAMQQALADYGAAVDFDVVEAFLEQDLGQGGLSAGFMTGAVTFCELLPMRAVPFKCICLLGMNEGDFPRIGGAASFDLIAANPKPGDRSKKNDDRYLFLETVLSARDTLYISYVGQSNKDGSDRLPSVLVSELLDYLKSPQDATDPRGNGPVIRHPMHSFSKKYFSGESDSLVSFSEEGYRAARALAVREAPTPLVTAELPALPDTGKSVDLENLAGFFKRPAEYFCRRRLGIQIGRQGHELEGTENFALANLDRYRAGNWLLNQLLSGKPLADSLEVLGLQGFLPHGSVGRAASKKLKDEVVAVAEKVRSVWPGEGVQAVAGEVLTGGFKVAGTVAACCRTGRQILYRFASISAEDRALGWLRHLFFNCLPGKAECCETIIIGTGEVLVLDTVADCLDLLAALLEMYRRGAASILPFFPKASLCFAENLAEKGEREALDRARKVWQGSEFTRGEGENPYYKLCFRGTDPFSSEFADTAVKFFGPFLEKRGRYEQF